MIVITAAFKAKAGQEKALEEILKSVIPDVQNEGGTVMYTLHRSAANHGAFLFYEKYKDQDALNFHSTTPYFKALGGKMKDLLDGKPQIVIYEDIASISR